MNHRPSMNPMHARWGFIMTEARPLICLDFDGVLCDSVQECCLATHNAFHSHQATTISTVPADFQTFFTTVRPLIGRSEQYCLVFLAFQMGWNIPDSKALQQLYQNRLEQCANFKRAFLKARAVLQQDLPNWLQLHRFYHQAEAVLEAGFPEFHIVTAKDRQSVQLLALHHGYANKILTIHSMQTHQSKADLLKQLYGANRPLVLVDDYWPNLAEAQHLTHRALLANWGYCEPTLPYAFEQISNLHSLLTDGERS